MYKRNSKSEVSLLFSLFCKRYTRTSRLPFFWPSPIVSPCICYFGPWPSWCHLWRMFSVAPTATYALSLTLQITFHVTHLKVDQKFVDQLGKFWTICWVRKKLKFQFLNCLNSCCCHMRLSIVMMQNSLLVFLSLLWIACFNFSSSIAQHCALLTMCPWS